LLAVCATAALYSPGCDELVTETIEVTIAGHPTADFKLAMGSTDSGCAPLSVQFDDESNGPIKKWTWYFGDGDSAVNDTNPIHVYDSAGVYNCTLKVEDPTTEGVDIEIKQRFIVVGTIVADIQVSDTLACLGQPISFRGVNLGGVTGLVWDFGDSTTQNTSEIDSAVTHEYDSAGIYTVELRALGGCGSRTYTKTDLIRVVECPDAVITAEPLAGCAPLKVVLADTASTAPAGEFISTQQWIFGNGQVSANAIDSVTYATADSFEVKLYVTASNGGRDSAVDTIVVHDVTGAAFATLTPIRGCKIPSRQFQVKFQNQSTGALDSFLWRFGDGDTAWNDPTPVHAYDAGYYACTLDVWGVCGADMAVMDSIIAASTLPPLQLGVGEVAGQVITLINLDTDTGVAQADYAFVDLSGAAGGKRWRWSFGDGSQDTDSLSYYAYDTAGIYQISLTIFNECDSLELIDTFVVDTPPVR